MARAVRDREGPRERGPRRAGLGLLAYGLAVAIGQMRTAAAGSGAEALAAVETVLVYLPALLWTGAVLTLVPGGERLDRVWSRGLVPVTLAGLGWLAASGWGSEVGLAARAVTAVLLLGPLAGVLVLLVRARPPRVGGLATVATLFFGLGAALLLFPSSARTTCSPCWRWTWTWPCWAWPSRCPARSRPARRSGATCCAPCWERWS
nr:hypothetical protein GCM10020093_077620 [Planobispora longispora]